MIEYCAGLNVRPDGLASRAGISSGDIIVAVGSRPVEDIREFRELISKEDLEKGVRMQVLRDGFRRFVFLRSYG